jgi:hypothetical protein
MHGTLTLLRHSLGRLRDFLLVMGAVLTAFQVLLILAGRALEGSGALSGLAALAPPFVRQMMGESLFTFMSFAGIVCLGYFHPIIIAALTGMVIAAATEPAAEVEMRFVDVVLARPVKRQALVTRSAVLVAVLPAGVLLTMVGGTAAGLRWLAPPAVPLPSARLIASLAVNLWALLFCNGGAALSVAAAARRRSPAAAVAGLAALALFLLDYLARAWEPASAIAWLSPFHYYRAMDLLMGRPLPASHIEALVGTGAVGVALAYVAFGRRDL